MKFDDGYWYPGKVTQTDAERGIHIVFDDNEKLWEQWPNKDIKLEAAQQTYRELITAALQHHGGRASRDQINEFVGRVRDITSLGSRLSEYEGRAFRKLQEGSWKLIMKPRGFGAEKQLVLLRGAKRQQETDEPKKRKKACVATSKVVSTEKIGSPKLRTKKKNAPKLTKSEEDRQHIERVNVSAIV
jgi:hypothetical protein